MPETGESRAALAAWPTGLDALAAGWQPLVRGFLRSAEGRRLSDFLQARLAAGATVYPPEPLRALQLTPPEAVRVVILGQDPYHGPRQACGLAFAVAPGVRPPPSLRNIYKELAREFGQPPGTDQPLAHWARQGVLLLNTSLTVEAGQAGSHARELLLADVDLARSEAVRRIWPFLRDRRIDAYGGLMRRWGQ